MKPREPLLCGTAWGLWIHRYHPTENWRAMLATVPEQHRANAERYLRDIAERIRVVRRLKGQ